MFDVRRSTRAAARSARTIRAGNVLALFSLLLLSFSACSDSEEDAELDTDYGAAEGSGVSSVNGLSVLANLFAEAGHEVVSVGRLSPRVEEAADVIVWAPLDFLRPDDETTAWFDRWLAAAPHRTLIYIGRDFDAELVYWRKVRKLASEKELPEVRQRYDEARQRFLDERTMLALQGRDWHWFDLSPSLQYKQATELSGDSRWLSGVDPAEVEIELFGRIHPQDGYPPSSVLLKSGDDNLVIRQRRGNGQVIVVANGSFLLNLPLVNRQHRKLAGALINEVGFERRVVFLETGGGSGGGNVSQEDPEAEQPTIFKFFWVYPLNFVTLGFLILFIIAVFALWPIFGRARHDRPRRLSDFGQHVTALGDLMKKTRDQNYALGRLAHYHQNVRGAAPIRVGRRGKRLK